MRPIEVVDRGAVAHPQRAAIIHGEQTLTYAQVRDTSCRIAQRLHALGLGPGTHGAVLAPNDAMGFVCSLGLMRAGVTWLPMNAFDALPQVGLLLDRLEAEVLFVHSAFAGAVDELSAAAPRIREVIVYDSGLEEWLGDAPAIDVDVPDDPAAITAIFPTSGTTGLPRGVMHSAAGFEVFIKASAQQTPHDGPPVFLAAAPLTHVSGRIALALMHSGGTVVVLHRADPVAILDALEEHAITMTMVPPTVLYALVDTPGIRERRFPALRYLTYGSAPTRVDMIKRAIELFGPVLGQGYGQTEAPMLITAMTGDEHVVDGVPAPDERLASVGRPTPFVTLTIRDEHGGEVAAGETGEVCVRGDFLMVGYHKDPEATAEVSRGGWHHTGDLGYLDAEGYLHLVDRKKDMIITGGFNVYSAEVERVIGELDGIAAVAVVGVPDARWGEAVTAAIVARPGAALDERQVIAHVKARLGSVKAPKSVDFRTELPRSGTGKILKRALREEYAQSR